jgi:hypothetical protein
LSDLIGGIESVTLSDEEARRRGTQKTVLERRAPPTFDILIEIQDRNRLAIHRNVASSVDSLLRGKSLGIELRIRDEDGEIVIEQEEAYPVPSPDFVRRRGGREQRDNLNSGRTKTNRKQVSDRANGGLSRHEAAPGKSGKTTRVYAYGVARNRLRQAARQLNTKVDIVEHLMEADVLVTLKSYFRRQRKLIMEAQNNRIPVYVLRANTVNQMESFLAEVMNLEAAAPDPFEIAIADTEQAIRLIQSGQASVDLRPVGSAIRRYQHQMARQADLVSHSYGKGSGRHVRIFRTPRN